MSTPENNFTREGTTVPNTPEAMEDAFRALLARGGRLSFDDRKIVTQLNAEDRVWFEHDAPTDHNR